MDGTRIHPAHAGYQKPAGTTVEKGTASAQRGREYPLNGRGMFVIIQNTKFNYTHRGTDWSKETILDYPSDVRNIRDTFQLENAEVDIVRAANLTPSSQNDDYEKEFDGFLKTKVIGEGERNPQKPAFLMFFLMSHGLQDGEFLLADTSGAGRPCCVNDQHTFQKTCRARKVYDVIHQIDSAENQKFLGVPKIFIIQTCRGSRSEAMELGKAAPPPVPPTEADKFLPECSDVFVLYAAIENQLSWVAKDIGSLLIKSFCDSIKATQKVDKQSGLLWEKLCNALRIHRPYIGNREDDLQALNNYIHKEFGLNKLYLTNDSVADGWIENICQQTIVKVTDYLLKRSNGVDTEYMKQQPQYASTLRFKLSMLKILEKLGLN